MKLRFALLATLLALPACGKDDDKAGKADKAAKTATPDKAGKTETPDKADKAKAGPLKIEAFGLTIDAPSGATLSEMAGSQMLQAPGLVAMIAEAGQFSAKTLDEELKEIADMYTGTDIKKEEIEGGWHVTFSNKGGMGTNYWVKSHLTFDGKAYTCGTTTQTAEQQANTLAACKSLKK